MKKFEITKEQIIELQEFYYSKSDLTNRLKYWFPDAFKKELEIGKWYKGQNSIFCLTRIEGSLGYAYGIDEGKWKDECAFGMSLAEKDVEATPQEVESALICEATKQNLTPENLKSIKCLCDFNNTDNWTLEKAKYYYEDSYNKLWIVDGNFTDCCIFDNGKWAEKIETITIQEAEKLLNKKIV